MKLVYIRWCDATGNWQSWNTKDEAIEWADNENWTVQTVGWIIKETKEYILMASKRGSGQEDLEEQFGSLFKLPKTWIRERYTLIREDSSGFQEKSNHAS